MGKSTNVKTDADNRTKASKLVGSLDDKHTAANKPAFRERGWDTNEERRP